MKFRRGGALILLGLLLNIGLNFTLLVNIFRGKFEADPFQYIFGADILPLAGLSILIIGLMEVLLKKRGIAALILAAAIPIITPFITGLPEHYKYVQAFIGSPEKWSYFPLFPWLAYPLLGYGWRRSEAEWPSVYDFIVKNLKIVLFISVALVLALALPAYRNITELGAYYHHGILLFCWMVGFIIAWSYLARLIIMIAEHAKIIQYIKWLGEHVTVVYIIQWLIIGNLAYYFHSSQFLVQLVIWFIMILSITSFITYLYVKWKSSWYSE